MPTYQRTNRKNHDSILCGKSNPAPIIKNKCRKIAEQSKIAEKNRLMPKALHEQGKLPALICAGQVVPIVVTHRLPARRRFPSETFPKEPPQAEKGKNDKLQAQSFHQSEIHK